MIITLREYFSILKKYLYKEAFYIFAGLFFSIIYQICAMASPFLTKYLIDVIIEYKNYSLLKGFLMISFSILLILVISNLFSNYILARSFIKAGARFKMDIFKKLQRAKLDFFTYKTGGEIAYRLLNDTQVIEDSWSKLTVNFPLQIVLLGSGLIMALWDMRLTLFVFLILCLQVLIIIKFKSPLLKTSYLYKQRQQEVLGVSVEHFDKIQLIKSLGTEKKEQIKFFKNLKHMLKAWFKYFFTGKIANALTLGVNNLWAFFILWYGGREVITGYMSLGTLVAFFILTNLLVQPITFITNFILSFQDVRASLERLKEYLEVKGEPCEEVSDFKESLFRNCNISFRNVSFGYNSFKVLKSVDIIIKPKTIFALVGKSGVGKTTLCRLLVRFYENYEGEIKINGKEIREIPLSFLRKNILFLLQNEFIISGTVWENLIYGVKGVKREDVLKAVNMANCEFIYNLPQGFNTLIGRNGLNLSVGELQRIALARAFLLKPAVLIMDEPTSFIDLETEEKIKRALLEIKRYSTIIVIAHRLSTVQIADKIGVLEDGRIIETGTHEELFKKGGLYTELVNRHLLK